MADSAGGGNDVDIERKGLVALYIGKGSEDSLLLLLLRQMWYRIRI